MAPTWTPPDPGAEAPVVLIRDDGRLADIHPSRLELLPELLVERRQFRPDGRGGLRLDQQLGCLFARDHEGRLVIPSGLVPRLAAVLRRAGCRAEIEDLTDPLIPDPAPEIPDAADDEERAILAALAGNRRGVIPVRSDRDRLAVLGRAMKVFAKHRIIVVAATRAEARKIDRHLRAILKEPVACCTRGLAYTDARVRVGTIGSLDPTVGQVIFFTGATQVLRADVPARLAICPRPRIYGLIDEQVALSRRQRLVIEAWVGPVIGRHGPAGERPPVVQAVFAAWPGKDRPDLPLGLAWKRQSTWHNEGRNAAIARLAGAFANGNMATLWEYGLFLDGEDHLRQEDRRRVVVLVESPEHARVLQPLLPGWPVLCADATHPGDDRKSDSTGSGRAEIPERAILTWVYARAIGRLEADVVLRADGTPWPLDLPLASCRPEHDTERPVLLVDLADHQDETARAATRARRRAYRQAGWLAGIADSAEDDEGVDHGPGRRRRGSASGSMIVP
jgi:hypothetical protein